MLELTLRFNKILFDIVNLNEYAKFIDQFYVPYVVLIALAIN